MKIAIIGHKVYPSRCGGIEVVVQELADRFAKYGHDVTIYNRMRLSGGPKEVNGVKVKQAFSIRIKNLDAVLASFSASISALFHEYDVIHYHAIGPSAALVLPKFFKRNTRIVATVHRLDWETKSNKFARAYLKLGEKIVAKYADEVIVVSPKIQRYFEQVYGRRVHFVPNGVNRINKVDCSSIREYGLEEQGYVLFVARVVPEKRLDLLIKAFRSLKTDLKLVVAGGYNYSDGYYNSVKALAGGDKRILFLGEVVGEKLWSLYSNARLYVLPSYVEGMPLTLLEAISFNCPVLTSDIEECISIVGRENTFACDSLASLSTVLAERIENRVDTCVNTKVYSWDTIAHRTLSLYGEVQASDEVIEEAIKET